MIKEVNDEKNPSSTERLTPSDRKSIQKWILQSAIGWVVYALIIFLSVGRLDWVWGWVLLFILVAMLISHPVLLIPINPALLVERSRGMRAEGTKKWDVFITITSSICMLISWVVAGLDERFAWTGLPIGWHIAGALLMAFGVSLFMWAMVTNAFFAEGVRIQTERHHAVCSQGPYRVVRHPGYVGTILGQLATPLLLGSLWAFIPSIIYAILLILRTHLEDKTLSQELPGYAEYTHSTRYRLIPGIW